MTIRSRVSITLCAVLLSLTIATNGQRASIKTADGYLFIQNGKDISLVCEVKGKDIKPLTTGENPAFMADGILLQIIWVPAGNFEPTGKVEPARLLETHQKWETDYLATVFGTPPLPETESVDLDGKRVMYWSFKRPKHSTEFD